ncbi:hypothetical protein OXX79_014197, partial [Metschnikowia pulcherrima]
MNPYHGLSLTDSGGKLHHAQGKGTIVVGGNRITCYFAPTLKVSVVSISDLRRLGENVLFHKNGNVYVSDTERNSFRYIGTNEDRKMFEVHFVGLQNKPDNFDAMHVHREYAHAGEAVIRELCKQNNIKFRPEDGERIRSCETCFQVKGKATSHNGHTSNPATRILYRIHLDSVEYGKGRHVTFITDEFSWYIWMIVSQDKGSLLKLTKAEVIRINQEFLPYEIVYVTKDNGTELPTADFLKNEVNAISEAIPAYTPELNGRAERANGIISLKAKA